MSCPSHTDRRRLGGPARGFTLIELLVVMSIIVLLLAAITPAFVGAVRAGHLTNAVNIVVDQLAAARQTAISRNRPVEVRFYQLSDPATGQSNYRALKAYIYANGTKAQALTRLYQFESPVSMSTAAGGGGSQSTALRVAGNQTEILPGTTVPVPYCKLVFSPNGRTDLGPQGSLPWYLTLYPTNLPITDNTNHLPTNWAVVQIDDYTGRVRVFRP